MFILHYPSSTNNNRAVLLQANKNYLTMKIMYLILLMTFAYCLIIEPVPTAPRQLPGLPGDTEQVPEGSASLEGRGQDQHSPTDRIRGVLAGAWEGHVMVFAKPCFVAFIMVILILHRCQACFRTRKTCWLSLASSYRRQLVVNLLKKLVSQVNYYKTS